MVTTIFTALKDCVSGFFEILQEAFNGGASIIYTTTEGVGELTTFGTMLLISAGAGLSIWGLKTLVKLIKFR